jgi:hypothetical protein
VQRVPGGTLVPAHRRHGVYMIDAACRSSERPIDFP